MTSTKLKLREEEVAALLTLTVQLPIVPRYETSPSSGLASCHSPSQIVRLVCPSLSLSVAVPYTGTDNTSNPSNAVNANPPFPIMVFPFHGTRLRFVERLSLEWV